MWLLKCKTVKSNWLNIAVCDNLKYLLMYAEKSHYVVWTKNRMVPQKVVGTAPEGLCYVAEPVQLLHTSEVI